MNGKEFARLSGSYNTAYIGTWELLSQDASTLTSTFKLRGYFYYGGGTQVSSSGTHDFYLDGTNIKSGSSYSYTPGTHFLGEKTITVKHNTDGTFPGRSVGISASGQTHMNGSTTGNITGVADIEVGPVVKIPVNSTVAYIKKEGTWHRTKVYLKNSEEFKITKEFYKEMGEWQ
jgi:hypothetical protein